MCISGSGMVSPDLTSGCLEYLMILICLSTILPSGALIAMYVAIQAGKIHNTLELKLHIGSHGRLTKPTLKDSTDSAIQLKIAIMKTIVKTMGFIIDDCIFSCSGIISI